MVPTWNRTESVSGRHHFHDTIDPIEEVVHLKLKTKVKLTTGALLLFGITLLQAQPVQAKIIKNSFVITKQAIKTTNSKKQVNLTIPKNTPLQVAGVKTVSGRKYLYTDVERLSYHLRKPLLSAKSTSTITRWLPATTANFKEIKKPVYLDYFAAQSDGKRSLKKVKTETGNLWKGSRIPVDYASQTGTRIRVTTDGYFEYYENMPFVFNISPQPTASVKVQSATHPVSSGRTILNFKDDIAQLPFVKLSADHFQLTIQGTSAGTITVIPNEDNVQKVLTSWISRINKEDWYEPNSITIFHQ